VTPESVVLEIRARIRHMAEEVVEMTAQALRSVTEGDGERARMVIQRDAEVDRQEIEIDRSSYGALAAGHLDAPGLRLVVASLKTTTDLERVGDESVKLAHAGLELAVFGSLPEREVLAALGEVTLSMLHDATAALAEGDAERARSVLLRDDEADRQYRAIADDVRARMALDLSALERLVQVRFAAKCLERIADHATNLAEQAIFIETGDDVRHLGKR
jgi:phosphate transport system protein